MKLVLKFCFILIALGLSPVHAEEAGVEVESPFYLSQKKNGRVYVETAPYRDMRSKWGVRLELGSSMYSPAEDNVDAGSSFYGGFGVNRNFQFFSVGAELGFLSTNIDFPAFTDVSVQMILLGGNFYLDGLFKTPYVVPFVGVGAALLSVDESTISDSDTQEDFAPYFKFGILAQLNWLDRIVAARGYSNFGLQNTFLVFQARNVSKTNSDAAFNFGSSMSFEVGVQLEF